MSVLLMTIPITVGLVVFFVLAYLSAVKDDQFDDLETPAHLPFTDDLEKDLQKPFQQKRLKEN